MSYDEITKIIFAEFENDFNSGIIFLKQNIINNYKLYDIDFDYKLTWLYFNSIGLSFINLKDAPEPINLHSLDPIHRDSYFLYNPKVTINPYAILAM